jgi:HD superfamily phosphohydrolase YqeK
MFKMAYESGAQAALSKYAGVAHDIARQLLAPQNLKRNLNVAGLGLIAAPAIHSLVSHGEDSPGLAKAKHTSDLAGLGMLIGTEFMRH